MFILKERLKSIEADIKVLYINVKRNTQAIHEIERDALIKEEFGIPREYNPLTQGFGQFIIKPKVKKRMKNEKTQKKKKLGDS